jgi:hypothetical protein
VLRDHPVDLAVARKNELEPACGRWAAGSRRRSMDPAPPPGDRNSWSYFDFIAMSSPNHFACSCASEWQPTLIRSAV